MRRETEDNRTRHVSKLGAYRAHDGLAASSFETHLGGDRCEIGEAIASLGCAVSYFRPLLPGRTLAPWWRQVGQLATCAIHASAGCANDAFAAAEAADGRMALGTALQQNSQRLHCSGGCVMSSWMLSLGVESTSRARKFGPSRRMQGRFRLQRCQPWQSLPGGLRQCQNLQPPR